MRDTSTFLTLFALGSALTACGSDPPPSAPASAGSGAASTAGTAGSGGTAGSAGSGGGGSGGTAGSGGAAAACMDTTSNHSSGTRLRARFAETSEGDRSWRGWFDSERGEPCSFESASDGVSRCLPSETTPGTLFSDAACSQRVGVRAADSCAPPAKYVSYSDYQDCSGGTRVHELGALLTPAALYRIGEEGCVETSSSATEEYYALGAEVPLTAFVSAERAQGLGDSRIATDAYIGSDGTLQVYGWRDTEQGSPCGFNVAEDDVVRCLPYTNLFAEGYADASCTTLALSHYLSQCVPSEPALIAGVTQYDEQGCASGRTVVQRGELLTTIYAGTEAACMVGTILDHQYFSQGATVPAETFVAIESVVNQDDAGRLKAVYNTGADGGCWFDNWFDSELSVPCSFEVMGDGLHHCIPDEQLGLTVLDTYSDAECSVPMPLGYGGGCGGVLPKYASQIDYSGCGESTIRAVMDVVDISLLPAVYRMSTSGTCAAYSPSPSPSADGTYVALGPVLEPGAFMAAEVVVE